MGIDVPHLNSTTYDQNENQPNQQTSRRHPSTECIANLTGSHESIFKYVTVSPACT